MKHTIIASALAMALPATAIAADLGPRGSLKDEPITPYGLLYQGTIGLAGLYTFADGSTPSIIDDKRHPGISGLGRVNIPLSPGLSIQVDIDGTSNFLSGNSIDDNYGHSFSGGLHLSRRDPNRYLFGLFGFAGVASAGEDEQSSYFGGGLEGQLYFGNLTLYGQAGYFTGHTEDNTSGDGIQNAWFLRGVGRYFFDPNTKLSGELTYAKGDIDFGGTTVTDDPMIGWGVEFERMLTGIPVAWTVGYSGSFAENKQDGTDYTDHTVRLGLKFHFGAKSLREIDRRGATLDTPDIGRFYGYAIESID